MRWKYRESRGKIPYLSGLVAAAVLILLCPAGELVENVYGQFFPTAAFCMDALAYGEESVSAEGRVMDAVAKELPLYSYSISYFGDGMMNRYYKEYVEILMQEAKEGTNPELTENGVLGQEVHPGESGGTEDVENGSGGTGEEAEGQEGNGAEENGGEPGQEEIDGKEGEPNGETIGEEQTGRNGEEERLNAEDSYFVITDGSAQEADLWGYEELIHSEKMQDISLEDYREFDALVGKFYTVDKSTYTTAEELNAEKLAAVDLKLEKGGEGPQILIYHTHAHEGYADSVEGDPATTVVGVGEHLAEILRQEYGYQVLHNTEQYDGDRDYAYSCALPALEQILTENPTIQVVIDLHRDSVAEENRLVTQVAGKPTARFMFFNGLSRVREVGEISYLPNENLQGNLAFSFQMQKACEEYYPGLTRKIYLKGYRYNMHVRPRTLLVELGAQNNTFEEAINACGPLARTLHIVLDGAQD